MFGRDFSESVQMVFSVKERVIYCKPPVDNRNYAKVVYTQDDVSIPARSTAIMAVELSGVINEGIISNGIADDPGLVVPATIMKMGTGELLLPITNFGTGTRHISQDQIIG